MRRKSYKNILYLIIAVIVITLDIQIYWNLKNYESGKQQLINEVQISLDNAVNQYYTELAEENTIRFASDSANLRKFLRKGNFRNLMRDMDSDCIDFKTYNFSDSIDTADISIIRSLSKESISNPPKRLFITANNNSSDRAKLTLLRKHDSIHQKEIFEQLTSKIVISITQDSLRLPKIDTLIQQEFLRKNITVDYGLKYIDPFGKETKTKNKIVDTAVLSTSSESIYLPKVSSLELFFTNEKLTIFKKNLLGILLSFLLMGIVIGCLLFLLRIINHQKQLAELKNDLISNITHEFKTPIATISAAIEGIQNFNQENDPGKTKKYATISSNQLSKLNIMVEKILETATLDSDKLQLNTEEIYLTDYIQTITDKHQVNSPEKKIIFNSTQKDIRLKIDVFHFENAINNVIDNAIKYGGNLIKVNINAIVSSILIEIEDNGKGLTKAHKEKIFEKFYRVPKGNTHDVKGFGIGLFYTKTIIEKHGGTIHLSLDKGVTNFKIILPNG
ncbi:sensor histidine kinase [Aquimarina algiphila]|uniref:sensor histidine kinase n=1 Tax=Aquimarina algiphila TaxID=2047982 RepID=UPI00232DF8FB|nr:HAMP domain-containing sensor histidine kinase [Aquimarina algiphila]